MTSELMIVDDDGQSFGLSFLRDERALASLDKRTFEELVYRKKELEGSFKKIDKELKSRLDDGIEFDHIKYGESSKQILNIDSKELKERFAKKYGIDAFVLKSPTQLKKQFGESIEEDLEKVVVYETQKRLKFE